jgi:hypothetical protein
MYIYILFTIAKNTLKVGGCTCTAQSHLIPSAILALEDAADLTEWAQ